jgi:hypothetical protein
LALQQGGDAQLFSQCLQATNCYKLSGVCKRQHHRLCILRFPAPLREPMFTHVIATLVMGAFCRLSEKALAHEYKLFYITHGLRHYPWWRRRLYLHYALFLHELTNRASPVSRETITRLRSFADIARRPPPPESRLFQPAYIVPFVVLLNVFVTEILKQAELLKGLMGIRILYLAALAIFLIWGVLALWHWITASGQAVDRTIQRFLQWAEHDMEETQRLRIRSPHMELPSSPES